MIPKIRRGTAEEKTAKSDPIYRNRLVNMLVNRILKHGKKSLAYQIIYRAVKKIQQKTETNPLSVLHPAIHGVTSGIAVKARRVGSPPSSSHHLKFSLDFSKVSHTHSHLHILHFSVLQPINISFYLFTNLSVFSWIFKIIANPPPHQLQFLIMGLNDFLDFAGREILEVHVCHRCRWPFPKPHPSAKRRRSHNRICGTVEGYTKLIVDSEADSDDERHSDSDDREKDKTPSPKIEKRIIKESGSSAGRIEEKSIKSEDDMFSDAVTEFSETGISPGVTSDAKKMDKIEDHDLNTSQIKFPDCNSKLSVPLVKDTDGSCKDKVVDQMSEVSGNKDQEEDVHELSVASDIPLVDKAETLIEDFKDHKTMHSRNKSVVDIFVVKTVQEHVHESQTSEYERIQEPKSSIEAKPNIGESSGKLLAGVDSLVGWSSSSLDGNWGSISELSDVFGKSEVLDDRRSRLDRSDAFEGLSLVESDQEIFEQKASEIKVNKEAIAKVTNWSTSEAKSSDPKRLSDLIRKFDDSETTSGPEKSNVTRETPRVNQESSAGTDRDETKNVGKKTKGIPSYQYPTRGKATVQKSGVLPVDSNTALVAQVEALTKMVKDLQTKGNAKCEICRGGHDTRQCPMLADDSHEQVKYAGNFNRGPGNAYGNSYNSGGRNQPDFTWKNGNPSGFNQHPHEQSGVTDERMARLEELMVQKTQMLTQVIVANQTVSARHDELIKTQGAAILSLDRKLEELADQLKERKPRDSSSNTEKICECSYD
ncbi:hypothetical protein E3N88_01238 [Mikania micrantha]|uniref:Small ribosomal subunit protein uS7 domain-containing protein n=1 Tax=Mikania micrantha TaxID=192012 RepID=A0A5N6Q0P1_9ASTR|nr:hypothetical protein E3N88_01238 [Mikania micrantha]